MVVLGRMVPDRFHATSHLALLQDKLALDAPFAQHLRSSCQCDHNNDMLASLRSCRLEAGCQCALNTGSDSLVDNHLRLCHWPDHELYDALLQG